MSNRQNAIIFIGMLIANVANSASNCTIYVDTSQGASTPIREMAARQLTELLEQKGYELAQSKAEASVEANGKMWCFYVTNPSRCLAAAGAVTFTNIETKKQTTFFGQDEEGIFFQASPSQAYLRALEEIPSCE